VTSSQSRRLADAAVGERWVIRARLPDGSATDLIGWLEVQDPNTLQLVTGDGALHRIERSTIIAARRAPAAAGGRDPRRISSAELERRALPGWLALYEPLGEWTLRAAGGFTGRANSCLAVGDPGIPIEQAAERIVGFARDHRIAPMAQVVTGSDEDAALRALGWVEAYVPTDVLAIRLSDLLAAELPERAVKVVENLDQSWWDAYQQSRPNTADPATLRMILDGNPPRAFASAIEVGEDVPFAIARGHLSGDWLGVASIWTREDRRRQGWATAMLKALGLWAARRGARYGYLQVASANTQAIAAYGRLGFVRHHGYHYLAPSAGQEAGAAGPRPT
jgi:ribosomal protein S18 acetylase RimI-like enzyme